MKNSSKLIDTVLSYDNTIRYAFSKSRSYNHLVTARMPRSYSLLILPKQFVTDSEVQCVAAYPTPQATANRSEKITDSNLRFQRYILGDSKWDPCCYNRFSAGFKKKLGWGQIQKKIRAPLICGAFSYKSTLNQPCLCNARCFVQQVLYLYYQYPSDPATRSCLD